MHYDHRRDHFYLTTGSKLGNMLHTRIRLNASDLKEHRTGLGKSESPTCDCGASKESTEHFILSCPLFLSARTWLFQEISAALETNFQSMPSQLKIDTNQRTEERFRSQDKSSTSFPAVHSSDAEILFCRESTGGEPITFYVETATWVRSLARGHGALAGRGLILKIIRMEKSVYVQRVE